MSFRHFRYLRAWAWCAALASAFAATGAAQDLDSLRAGVRDANLQAKTVRATYTLSLVLPAPGQAPNVLHGQAILDYACDAAAADSALPLQRFVLDLEAQGGGQANAGDTYQLWTRATYDGQRLMLQRLAGPLTGDLSVFARPPRVSEQPLSFNTVFLPLPGTLLLDTLAQEFTSIQVSPEALHEGHRVWSVEATPVPGGPLANHLAKVILQIDQATGIVRHAAYQGLQGDNTLELRATELAPGLLLPEGTFTLPTP